MAPRVLLALLVLTAILAGCASPNNGNGGNSTSNGTGGTTSGTVTNDQARALLASAATDIPDKVAVTMHLDRSTQTLLTIVAAFDNATGVSDITFNGDLSSLVPTGDASMGMMGQIPKSFEIYATKTEYVFSMNGTAFVLSADALKAMASEFGAGGGSPASIASVADSPFSPHTLFENFTGDNVTVQSVTPTTYHGQAAVQALVTTKNDTGGLENVTIVLSTGTPARVLHLESSDISQLPPGTRALADFAYGSDVTIAPSATVTRVAGLAYSSGGSAASQSADTVWTFTASGGIAASEVEVVMKDMSGAGENDGMGGMGGMMDYSSKPDLFTMKLSEGTKSQSGITITFADKDHDSKVSKGDTVTITMSNDAPLSTPVLRDTTTGTYVVPGPGVPLVLAALGLAFLVTARREER